MKKKSYLQRTAKVFGSAGKPGRGRPKAPPRSTFVKFFERLEKDVVLPPFSKGEEWMRAVREEMTKAKRWPAGLQDCELIVVVEYISRLLRHFWNANPTFDRWTFNTRQQLEDFYALKHKPSLEAICEHIRKRGKRDGTYIAPWYTEFLTKESSYLYSWQSGGIIRELAIPIDPWRHDCSVAKMIAFRKADAHQQEQSIPQ